MIKPRIIVTGATGKTGGLVGRDKARPGATSRVQA
jgi:hypothetical protein